MGYKLMMQNLEQNASEGQRDEYMGYKLMMQNLEQNASEGQRDKDMELQQVKEDMAMQMSHLGSKDEWISEQEARLQESHQRILDLEQRLSEAAQPSPPEEVR